MKKNLLLLCSIVLITFTSCSSDDDSGATTNALVGTTWNGQETTDGIYSFASETTYSFVDPGETPVSGTYTFNGNSGVLTEETGFTADFSVSGGIMEVQGVNSVRVYIKQ